MKGMLGNFDIQEKSFQTKHTSGRSEIRVLHCPPVKPLQCNHLLLKNRIALLPRSLFLGEGTPRQ
jgi:hypothetical protein